jgi:hypothetical protein
MLVFTTTCFRPKSRKRKLLPPPSKPKTVFKEFTPPAYVRETKQYPSVDTGVGNTSRKDSPRYTGTLVKGIATMHKSNAVPILNEQDATDISRMRR